MQASRSVFAGFFHDPVREGETTHTVPCGGLVCTILHLHICARATAGGDASSPCCVRSSGRAKSTGAAVTDTCISEFGDVRGGEWTTQRKNLMVFRGEHRSLAFAGSLVESRLLGSSLAKTQQRPSSKDSKWGRKSLSKRPSKRPNNQPSKEGARRGSSEVRARAAAQGVQQPKMVAAIQSDITSAVPWAPVTQQQRSALSNRRAQQSAQHRARDCCTQCSGRGGARACSDTCAKQTDAGALSSAVVGAL